MEIGRMLLLLGWALAGCGAAEREPRTRVLAGKQQVGRVLHEACRTSPYHDMRYIFDQSLPRGVEMTYQARCVFEALLPGGTGPLQIELRGRGGYDPEVCAIRIGPDPIRAPLDIDFLFRMVSNPVLSWRLRAAVGTIDPLRAYKVVTFVDGVRVRFEQFMSPLDGPNLELQLDGCGRLPLLEPDNDATRTIGGLLPFRPRAE